MIKALVKLAILASVGMSLIGCSPYNTRGQNTAIGAVTGAGVGGIMGSAVGGGTAVGAGIVTGALVGGVIGHSMDSSDTARTYSTMNHNRAHQPTAWKNKKTGYSYKVVPDTGMVTYHGHPQCRKFHTTAIVNGKRVQVTGVACRQKNGTWKAVK